MHGAPWAVTAVLYPAGSSVVNGYAGSDNTTDGAEIAEADSSVVDAREV
jgi:hypothetical protein